MELKKLMAQIEAAVGRLKLPGYLKDLPGELIEDAEESYAETMKLEVIFGEGNLLNIFKSKLRTKWFGTYNGAWSRADWWVKIFVRPFVEPVIMKAFRNLWSQI